MPGFVIAIATWLGISPIRLLIYAGLGIAAFTGAMTIRQHYINLGWNNALKAVEKQDDRSKAAAAKVKQKTDECLSNSYWDVITQSCKGDEQ